jgi:hypothetical protein
MLKNKALPRIQRPTSPVLQLLIKTGFFSCVLTEEKKKQQHVTKKEE